MFLNVDNWQLPECVYYFLMQLIFIMSYDELIIDFDCTLQDERWRWIQMLLLNFCDITFYQKKNCEY